MGPLLRLRGGLPNGARDAAGDADEAPAAVTIGSVSGAGGMPQFGTEHVAALLVIAIALVVCTALARRATRRGEDDRAQRVLAGAGWAMLATSVGWQVWTLLPANFDVDQSLPFHFSDALRILTAIAMITRAGWAVAIVYYWGLTLNLQSVLTPDLNYLQFPALEFAMYWIMHAVPLIVPVVFTWGLRVRPTWRGYRVAFCATVAWSFLAFVVNLVTGANYSYVSGGPAGTSLLDVLGPWPLYLVSVALLMLAVWALMTWPWQGGASEPLGRFGFIARSPRMPRSAYPPR